MIKFYDWDNEYLGTIRQMRSPVDRLCVGWSIERDGGLKTIDLYLREHSIAVFKTLYVNGCQWHSKELKEIRCSCETAQIWKFMRQVPMFKTLGVNVLEVAEIEVDSNALILGYSKGLEVKTTTIAIFKDRAIVVVEQDWKDGEIQCQRFLGQVECQELMEEIENVVSEIRLTKHVLSI